MGGRSQKFILRICPGMPDKVKELFTVTIGYFDPKPIRIVGYAPYPGVLTSLPRKETKGYIRRFEVEKKTRTNEE